MIRELQKVFHSIIKSLEVLYVMEDAKPCARILVFEEELAKAVGFLQEKNIKAEVSDFKTVKQNLQSEFYSDKSIKIPKNDPRKGYLFVYLSKNAETARKAKSAEAHNDHNKLGLLLGYPKCCCDFFEKNFNENNTDLTLDVLENSDGYEFDFYANIAARHFDVALLSHFPHSFQCQPSIEIAKNSLEIMRKHSEQLVQLFLSILKSTVIYTINDGIFLLRKYEKLDDMVIYGDVLSTAKSKLYFLVSSNSNLKVVDKNIFSINDIKIEGKDYGLMVFK